MDIKDFYTLGSKLSSSTFQVHAVGLNPKEDKEGLFDEHRLIKGIYEGITFPVTFKQEYGRKLEDVLDTGWPSLYLISEKFKNILLEYRLTGWNIFSVKLFDKKETPIEGYHGLSVKGRCGSIDYGKCELIEKRLVPNGPLVRFYKGLYIDLGKWDGSDFFLPENNFRIIVTKKIMETMKENKVTNVAFKNLSEIETRVA